MITIKQTIISLYVQNVKPANAKYLEFIIGDWFCTFKI